MAADPNLALRAELVAALAILDPQIRGLVDLASLPFISAALATAISAQMTGHERRRSLISDVLKFLDAELVALTALEADGYPEMPSTAPIAAAVLAELLQVNADLQAAVGVSVPAVSVGLDLAHAIIGVQPVPQHP